MSRLERAVPGASGVIVYQDVITRDAAAVAMPNHRPEILFKPVPDCTWLAWWWPAKTETELPAEAAERLALRAELQTVSKKYCDALAEARSNPGERALALTAEFNSCQSLYHAVKARWAEHGFTVAWSHDDPTNVYVTWAEA